MQLSKISVKRMSIEQQINLKDVAFSAIKSLSTLKHFPSSFIKLAVEDVCLRKKISLTDEQEEQACRVVSSFFEKNFNY